MERIPSTWVALTESQESSYKGVGRAKRRDDASQLVVKVKEAVGVILGIWQKQTEIFPGASKRYTVLVLAWDDKFCRKFLIFFFPPQRLGIDQLSCHSSSYGPGCLQKFPSNTSTCESPRFLSSIPPLLSKSSI